MAPNEAQQASPDKIGSKEAEPSMSKPASTGIAKEREMIAKASQKGRGALAWTFLRLSGPGWLQSGITIGGVSFSSSLYLGILSGFALLWLQPLVMILGIVMLAAISYTTLSIGQRPLRPINRNISPVLGWSWLFASMAANLVWSMPQFTLGTRAIQQNLLPNLLGPEAIPDPWGRILCVCFLLAICIIVTMFYGAGARGVKIFEIIIKSIVSLVVLSFFAVVLKLSFKEGGMDWGQALHGLIPNPRLLFSPAEGLTPFLTAVAENCRKFWTDLIISQQRNVMVSAAAATVGVNMTFLLPYSMLRRGWDRQFRGLAIFDLSTGLFIPFVLATGFVVMASASRFFTVPAPGFVPDKEDAIVSVEPAKNLVGPYKQLLKQRLAFEIGDQAVANLSPAELEQKTSALPYADRRMAAMLVKRDNFNLAKTLEPLTGPVVAQYIFGLGVMGLGIGAATVLMSINGLCLCELLNKPLGGWTQRIGSLMVSVGALGAIFWNQPAPWLAIPTSAFCTVLLPIAYFIFLVVMNQRKFLGDNLPKGGKRILWNILMALATAVATFISVWSLWSRLRYWGILIIIAFIGLILVVHFMQKAKRATAAA